MTIPVDSSGKTITLTIEDYRANFRLPTGLDLASIETCTDTHQAEEQLLRRCIQSVVRTREDSNDGEILDDVSQLPAALTDAIIERMAQADPQADMRLALNCPNCNHEWHATFDIATYLMKEIHNWAKRILREVHDLARAYGWREADILAMTPTRRRAYAELLGLG